MQRRGPPQPQFVLSCGHERLTLAGIVANGRPVANGHELAHVVQQRQCELVLSLTAESGSSALASFKEATGLKADVAIIDSKNPGIRIPLANFKDSASGTSAHYFPGNTKYGSIKLSRS